MEALRKARVLLFGSCAILLSLGLVMIYSASAIYALDNMKDTAYFLKRHLVYLLIGAVLAKWASAVDTQRLRRHARPILGVGLALLVLVLVPHVGHATGGARRWFRVLGFSFQPSEYLKIALIFYMADFLARKKEQLVDLKKTVFPAIRDLILRLPLN